MNSTDQTKRILAELSEWHYEQQAPRSSTEYAEMIALASLTSAPAELIARATADYEETLLTSGDRFARAYGRRHGMMTAAELAEWDGV